MRRRFLSKLASVFMGAGLLSGYGGLLATAIRFLYPAHPPRRRWAFVALARVLKQRGSIVFEIPGGESVLVADRPDAPIALSSTCPHLGCQVHWQPSRQRFLCPCHNGVFDANGTPLEGPPAKDGTPLSQYALKIESGVVFMDIPESDEA